MRAVGMRSAVIAALLATVPAGCGLLDPEAPAQEQILFINAGTGGEDIFRMHADGSGLVNLTRPPDGYQSLDVTPDGRGVVFYRESDCQISSMAPDGSDQKPLGESCNRLPRLSPNGLLVAYESGNAIHVMEIDGTGSREVSRDLSPVQPSSCGGNRLLFRVNDRDHTGVVVSSDIHVVNADGMGMVNLTRNASFDTEAVWVA